MEKMNKYLKWRYENNLTQDQVCEMMDISKTTLWKLEKEKPMSNKTRVYLEHKFNELIKEEN